MSSLALSLKTTKSMKITLCLYAAFCIIAAFLTTACGDRDPKQLITNKSWDLVEWSDNGAITKNMDYLPTVNFKDGEIRGSGGLNGYRVKYKAKADGGLKLGGGDITERGGPRDIMKMEQTYFDLLFNCNQWSIANDTLTLSDGTKENLLRFKTGIRKLHNPGTDK